MIKKYQPYIYRSEKIFVEADGAMEPTDVVRI